MDAGIRDREPSVYVVRAFDLGNDREEKNLRRLEVVATGPPYVLFDDGISGGASAWRTAPGSAADSGTDPWEFIPETPDRGTPSWFCANEPAIKDQTLELVDVLNIPAGVEPVLEFHHRVDLEFLWDGGRLEYSTDRGNSWHDILEGDGDEISDNPDRFLVGRYSATLQDFGNSNPLAGQRAWTGDSQDWYTVKVDLSDFTGHGLLLRWRLGCDSSRAAVGWWVDQIVVYWITSCRVRSTVAPRRGSTRIE
jgi:hypothetical protein